MVLDAEAMPMQRIWCVFEVCKVKEFKKSFQLLTNEGGIVNTSVETLEAISE